MWQAPKKINEPEGLLFVRAHTVNVTTFLSLKFHHKTAVICYDHKSKFSLQYWHCQFSLWAFLLVIHFQVIFYLLSHSRSMMDKFIRPSSTRSSHHGNNQSGTSFFILSGAFKTFLSWFSFFCIDANTVVTSSAKRLFAVCTAVTDGHYEKREGERVKCIFSLSRGVGLHQQRRSSRAVTVWILPSRIDHKLG